MIYEEQTNEIREICETLFKNGEIDMIVAYTEGGVNDMLIPFFAERQEDVAQIVWGDRCYQNLAAYLHGLRDTDKKIGIVAKPCDVRAVAQYVLEKQLKKENIFVIGVECRGMVDGNGHPRPGCDDCAVRKPPVYDAYVKDPVVDGIDPALHTAAADGLNENYTKFKTEIDKCILCFACRQACYGCYCKECFIERDLPDWQPASIDEGTKMTFHMGRAMHLAGRCVECGACEASCESGVDVRYIIKNVTGFIKDEYGYSAGMDPEQAPALLTYKTDDREAGFLGGDSHG